MTALAVVIVAHDSARDAPGHAARALRAQLADGDELLIVDNASSRRPRGRAPTALRVLRLERNLGFAGGCNAGAAATTAPLLFFLNPDARPAPGCLEALRAAAGAHPGWGAWQALVTLPGGARGQHPRRRDPLARPRLGGRIRRAGGRVPQAARGCRLRLGRRARRASRRVGRRRRLRARLLHVRRGPRPVRLRLRLAGWGVGMVPAARVEHDYEFAKGAYKWFHLERNRVWTVHRCLPRRRCSRLTAPALIGLELALLVVAARGGWLRPKLQAQLAVLRTLPWALRRRRRVQALRRTSPATFAAAMTAVAGLAVSGGAGRAGADAGGLLGRGAGAAARRESTRVRTILLTPELPFAPGGSGGSTRQYQLMRQLRARGVDVAVVASVHPDQSEGAERLVAEGVEVHLEWRPAHRAREALGALRDRPALVPAILTEPLLAWQVDVFWTRLRHRFADAVSAGRPDVVLIDHDWAANWHRHLPAGVPRALTLQNLSWRYYAARARVTDGARRAAFDLEARRWLRYDRRHLRRFELLIAMSERDAEVAGRVLGMRAVAVPNGVDTTALRPAPAPAADAPPVLLYTGTMSYPPNAEGLRWLLDAIWPTDPERAAGRRARGGGQGSAGGRRQRGRRSRDGHRLGPGPRALLRAGVRDPDPDPLGRRHAAQGRRRAGHRAGR